MKFIFNFAGVVKTLTLLTFLLIAWLLFSLLGGTLLEKLMFVGFVLFVLLLAAKKTQKILAFCFSSTTCMTVLVGVPILYNGFLLDWLYAINPSPVNKMIVLMTVGWEILLLVFVVLAVFSWPLLKNIRIQIKPWVLLFIALLVVPRIVSLYFFPVLSEDFLGWYALLALYYLSFFYVMIDYSCLSKNEEGKTILD